jgi:hypothetical protein
MRAMCIWHVTTKSIAFIIQIKPASQLASYSTRAMFHSAVSLYNWPTVTIYSNLGLREMTKTTHPSKLAGRAKRKPRLNWEQEFVAKYGLPVPVRISARQLAMLSWGMRHPVRCFLHSPQEGAQA